MSCLGVHVALTPEEVEKLRSFEEDSERLDYFQNELEEAYFAKYEEFLAQSDKAWDAIHRSLGDGQLSYTSGPDPLRLAVIGGEPLYTDDNYIMSLKTPNQVAEVADGLLNVTKSVLRSGYDRIDTSVYGSSKSDQDFEYTWGWFEGVVAFYQKAASAKRYVLFTADQ